MLDIAGLLSLFCLVYPICKSQLCLVVFSKSINEDFDSENIKAHQSTMAKAID